MMRSWPKDTIRIKVVSAESRKAIGTQISRAAVFSIARRPASAAGGPAFTRRQIEAGGAQLSACCHNVAAARRAYRAGVAGAIDDLGEALDLFPIGALMRGAGPGIERDQVDLGGNAGHQLHQRLGVGQAVVE